MASTPDPGRAAFLSTGVVARALGLDQSAVRAMIEAGTLPEPQWISFGTRVERAYSLEWLLLAGEQLNLRRLPGLEHEFDARTMVHFAVRFDHPSWTLDELSQRLTALNRLWKLCAQTLSSDESEDLPPLTVRRLSAGSPLDLLAWVGQNWGGVVGTGGIAAVFIYALKNPEKIAEAIPRALASWRDNWAKADDARVRQLESKINRKAFEVEAKAILAAIDAVPSETALSGSGTSRLELVESSRLKVVELDHRQGSTPLSPAPVDSADR